MQGTSILVLYKESLGQVIKIQHALHVIWVSYSIDTVQMTYSYNISEHAEFWRPVVMTQNKRSIQPIQPIQLHTRESQKLSALSFWHFMARKKRSLLFDFLYYRLNLILYLVHFLFWYITKKKSADKFWLTVVLKRDSFWNVNYRIWLLYTAFLPVYQL